MSLFLSSIAALHYDVGNDVLARCADPQMTTPISVGVMFRKRRILFLKIGGLFFIQGLMSIACGMDGVGDAFTQNILLFSFVRHKYL